VATQLILSRPARRPAVALVWLGVLAVAFAVVMVMGRSGFEAQMYLVTVALVAMVAVFLLPKAVARDGTLTLPFVATALGAHLVGSLLRYFIIQAVYHGVADANGYYGAGKVFAPLFRSLQFPALKSPYFGTPFVNWTTGILFALIGATMLGGFVVHSALAFVGGWYFYKAFRVAFPDGDHRLFAILLFFLPSMWYWPSSLGKDSLVVLFLGLAVYGFALLFSGQLFRGFVPGGIGLLGSFMIRPPIATAVMVAASAAFLLRPARRQSPQITALTWLVTVPLLSLAAFFTITHSATYLGSGNAIDAFQQAQSTEFHTGLIGSNFTPPNALSPTGFPLAVITTNFRPFPWEAGGLFPTLTSLEGVLLGILILSRRRQILGGFRRWRSNGMVLFAGAAFLAFSIILASLANFGLLARQRTQVLPFLFMLICMVAKPRSIRPDRLRWQSAAVETGDDLAGDARADEPGPATVAA
jgi:hypothetical protein